jgi:MtN3 and saliva related transmembrane protein
MNPIKFLGLAAGTLTTLSFLPQVIKTWKTRSAKDLSLVMFSVFCLGTFLWLLYGVFREDVVIVLANGITLVLSASLLYFKLRYKDR